MTETIVLDSLRKLGTSLLRIEWLGDVSYAGRCGGRAPLLNVVLAQASNGQWIRHAEDGEPPLTAAIPIGFLRLLRIGDIWAHGKRVGRDPGSVRMVFSGLEINDSTTEIRPIGLPIETANRQSSYLLPFPEFSAHRSHTGAWCARVTTPEGVTLVVPCIEIIRFYFGASGALLKRLFSGAFALDNLFTSARCASGTGVGNLTLAPGLPFGAAPAVARIAFDGQARRAAAWISKSGVAAMANGERYYPKTTFPLYGRTNLSTYGRWLNTDVGRVFLVEQILQCTHPFPFKRLYARSTTAVAGERLPDGLRSRSEAASRDKQKAADDRTLVESYVTSELLPFMVEVEEELEQPFPDLLDKPIHRIAEDLNRWPSRPTVEEEGCLASGTNLSNRGKREAEVAAAQTLNLIWDTEPKEVMEFRAAFQKLRESGETTASLCPPVPREPATNPKSPFQRGDWTVSGFDERSRNVWCTRILEENPLRTRQLFVVIRPAVDIIGAYRIAIVNFDEQEQTDAEISRIWNGLAANGWIPDQSKTANVFRGGRMKNSDALLDFVREALAVPNQR